MMACPHSEVMTSSKQLIARGVQMCPFLKNIVEPTNFNLKGSAVGNSNGCNDAGRKGPIFEDGPNFDIAFKLFHGSDGVVPLAGTTETKPACPYAAFMSTAKSSATVTGSADCPVATKAGTEGLHFQNALAASTAAISLSSFGPAGPFGYESFRIAQEKKKNAEDARKRREQQERDAKASEVHEAAASEWLATGNCPIAKTYRAFSGAIPLVAKLMTPPPGMKYHCPPAIVAARAALARTPAVKALRPQALPVKVLAVGALGMGLNVPLGVWREHCEKFSPQWILAVHAAVPLVAMLRKAVLMPKYAMAFTIASCVIGQTIGAKLEKRRLQRLRLQSMETKAVGLPSLGVAKKTKRKGYGKGQIKNGVASQRPMRAQASAASSGEPGAELGHATSANVDLLRRCSDSERSCLQPPFSGSGSVTVC